MTDLTTFLRARLDEDEATARIVGAGGYEPPTWHAGDDPHRASWMPIHAEDRLIGAPADHAERDHDPFALVANRRAEWAHIIRWDPARVLAEVDAKRRILARHRPIVSTDDLAKPEWYGACDGCGPGFDGPQAWTMDECPELRDMASVYADHPDYREEWRP